MSSATFVFSLDCEGKWGAADHLDDAGYRLVTNDMLADVYRRLVEILDRHEIPATFAFVSSFCLTPEQVRAHREWFAALDYRGGDWFNAFRADFEAGRYDGWLCPSALDSVLSHGGHEIGSHGFSHVPLGETDIGDDAFRREMDSVRAAEALRGMKSETFIFPRNRVGYLPLLAEYGYRGYRPAYPGIRGRGLMAKVGRYLNEFNPLEPPRPHADSADLIAVPAGRMLLARAGPRRWVPAGAIAKKFEIMLDRAIARDQVVHVFTHPHDFVTGRRQFDMLEGLLSAVADRARGNELRVMTQRDYCDWLGGSRPEPASPKQAELGYA